MADRTWRRFDKTSYVFHVFRSFFFLISLIMHESYRNECRDNYYILHVYVKFSSEEFEVIGRMTLYG